MSRKQRTATFHEALGFRALALVLAAAASSASCGSGVRHDGADVGVDAPSGQDGGDAVGGAAGTSCEGIRLCLAAGQTLDVCVGRGTDAAQATFNALLVCLRTRPTPPCAGTDMSCTCREECYADGACLDETAACVDASGATTDGVCVQYCGG